MNIDRLTYLITVLENVIEAKKKFSLDHWVSVNLKEKNPACGTTACVLGYAALDPKFNTMGLKLEIDYDIQSNFDNGDMWHTHIRKKVASINTFNKEIIRMNKIINDITVNISNLRFEVIYDMGKKYGVGYDAGSQFFDIEYETSDLLFSPGAYSPNNSGPRRVIQRIQYLIANGEDKFLKKYEQYRQVQNSILSIGIIRILLPALNFLILINPYPLDSSMVNTMENFIEVPVT